MYILWSSSALLPNPIWYTGSVYMNRHKNHTSSHCLYVPDCGRWIRFRGIHTMSSRLDSVGQIKACHCIRVRKSQKKNDDCLFELRSSNSYCNNIWPLRKGILTTLEMIAMVSWLNLTLTVLKLIVCGEGMSFVFPHAAIACFSNCNWQYVMSCIVC